MSTNPEFIDNVELGGSVFELIEFSVVRHLPNGQTIRGIYGVNVAKVREVLSLPKINPLSSTIPMVAGLFELRGTPIPAINLARALGDADAPITPTQQIIVTEFSQKRAGFIVTSTHRIRRVAWDKVMPPSTDATACFTGMTLIENREFLFILDLEKILANIEFEAMQATPAGRLTNSRIQSPSAFSRREGGADAKAGDYCVIPSRTEMVTSDASSQGPRILLVDDSPIIISTMRKVLTEAGFSVAVANNGEEALHVLETTSHDDSDRPICAVVTDVEMPRMDGLTLTKRIRETSRFREIPVILHSSLSGRATQDAGLKVGANGYVVKNNARDLLAMLKETLGNMPGLRLGA